MIHGRSTAIADFWARGGRLEATVAVMLNVKCLMNIKGHAVNLARKHKMRFAGNARSEDFSANLMNQVG